MVKPLTAIFALMALLATLVLVPGHASANNLSVEPDRTELYEGEVLTLTIKGSMEISINFDNLFDLGAANLPAPDVEKLEQDFEVLANNQRYSIRTINSKMVGEITWTYQLAPKSTGDITIPSLSFRGAQSDPVTVSVLPGNAPAQGTAESKSAFIELAADKDELYVQEQLVLTVRLFFTGNLIRGELSEPSHPDALVESLGRQQEYSRYRDGQRYRVVERRYAIFPKQPGTLALEAIRFEGQSRDAGGQLRFLRDSATLFELPVKPVPASFSGDTWLPASTLELTETGIPGHGSLTEGDNLARTLVMTARGLPSETLPPFPDRYPDSIRSYPESPERSTEPGPDGLTATLTRTHALVAIRAGEVTLPEIRIPWWDTTTDTEQVAVIPARQLTVAASGAAPARLTGSDAAPVIDSPTTTSSSGAEAATSSFWPWLSAVLAAGWAVTLLASVMLWKRRSPTAFASRVSAGSPVERELFERLRKAARAGSPQTLDLLPRWLRSYRPDLPAYTLADVERYVADEKLAEALTSLQARLFGQQQPEDGEGWDGENLVTALDSARAALASAAPASGLPPLYPEQLASR